MTLVGGGCRPDLQLKLPVYFALSTWNISDFLTLWALPADLVFTSNSS